MNAMPPCKTGHVGKHVVHGAHGGRWLRSLCSPRPPRLAPRLLAAARAPWPGRTTALCVRLSHCACARTPVPQVHAVPRRSQPIPLGSQPPGHHPLPPTRSAPPNPHTTPRQFGPRGGVHPTRPASRSPAPARGIRQHGVDVPQRPCCRVLLPRRRTVQVSQIKEILFTQRFVLAPEAQRLGIVNRVTPLQDLMPEALKLARVMALGDSYHLWMMKKMVNAAQDAAGLPAHVRASLDTVRRPRLCSTSTRCAGSWLCAARVLRAHAALGAAALLPRVVAVSARAVRAHPIRHVRAAVSPGTQGCSPWPVPIIYLQTPGLLLRVCARARAVPLPPARWPFLVGGVPPGLVSRPRRTDTRPRRSIQDSGSRRPRTRRRDLVSDHQGLETVAPSFSLSDC